MKILKGISTFLFLLVLFGSCFDPPSFPVVPYIEIESIVFVEGKTITESDSLNLTIHFQDGDGDLGLPIDEIDPPYNNLNFFIINSAGQFEKIPTWERYTDLPPVLDPGDGQIGKLVSVRTRKNPDYDTLPAYTVPYSCIKYIYDSIYISEEHKYLFDDTYNLYKVMTSSLYPKLYVLLDTFYYEPNPHYNNITVDFLVKQNDGSFKKFDWATEFCSDNAPGDTYDGRFPVLAEKSGPLEGTLKYAMVSSGFVDLFSTKTLKLRIQVFDRALNASNVEYSGEFTLR